MILKKKPSVKLKRRYLKVKAKSKKQVETVILEYLGILGFAEALPQFPKTKFKNIILAINTNQLDDIRAAFAISQESIEILKVSGTLKGLN